MALSALERGLIGGATFGTLGAAAGVFGPKLFEKPEEPSFMSDEEEARIKNELQTQQTEARNLIGEVRQETVARQKLAQKQQAQSREDIMAAQSQFESTIDQQLGQMLAQAGFQAGQQRQQVGASLANRGLMQSTQAGREVGEVTAAELGQKALLRSQATEAVAQRREAISQTFAKQERQREASQIQNRLQRAQAATDILGTIDSAKLKAEFEGKMRELQVSEAEAEQNAALLGAIGGGIGAIFGTAVGGPLGGMAGASAGSSLGRGIG